MFLNGGLWQSPGGGNKAAEQGAEYIKDLLKKRGGNARGLTRPHILALLSVGGTKMGVEDTLRIRG